MSRRRWVLRLLGVLLATAALAAAAREIQLRYPTAAGSVPIKTWKDRRDEGIVIPCPAAEHGGEKVLLTFRQRHGRWLVSCPGCTKERLREVLKAQGWWTEIAADPAQTPGQGVRCDPQGRCLQ